MPFRTIDAAPVGFRAGYRDGMDGVLMRAADDDHTVWYWSDYAEGYNTAARDRRATLAAIAETRAMATAGQPVNLFRVR